MHESRTGLVVSSHGFYLDEPTGPLAWCWQAITSMQVTGPEMVELVGQADDGTTVRWALVGQWAELVFGLWAANIHPRHPQLVAGQWLPPGWLDWARRVHPSPPPALTQLSHHMD
ncbi:hypothetical protein AGMMS50218_18010 [Actinomycetota bacterium]|nr:hypothetical protein AGMMS50218_18010 [Actinomycetota bacterium]